MVNKSFEPGTETVAETKSALDDVTAELKDKASDLGHRASDLAHKTVGAIDAQRGSAASGLKSAAYGLHASADKLPPGANSFAHQAADKLNETANYVRTNKLEDMAADLGRYVKRNPTQAVLGALVIGFFAGRFLRR